MKIGNIDIPCVTVFDAGSTKRATEIIAPLGTNLHVIAEFEPDPISLEISGTLYKKNGKSADQYAEDLETIASRKSIWNYVHNVQGKYGFVSVSALVVDPREASKASRDFSIDGNLLPLSEYGGGVRASPVVLNNDFGITIDDCIPWVLIPSGSLYAAIGTVRTIGSEYGGLAQTSGHAHFMPAGVMDCIGEVQIYDGNTKIYSQSHLVDGILTVKNGLYSVAIDRTQSLVTISYWSGSEYTKIDDFTFFTFTYLYLKTCRPDLVEVVLSTGDRVVLEAGRPPLIDATLIYSETSPENQTTGEDNFLVLGEGLYVASTQAFRIASGAIEGPGNKWIFHATSAAEQEAKNCLVDLQTTWSVERRW